MESLSLSDASAQATLHGIARTSGHSVVRIGEHVHDCVIDISIDDEASWDVTIITSATGSESLKITQKHTLGRGARLGLHIITLHPNVDHDLVSHVKGESSESSIDWMFYAKGSEKQMLTVRNIFDGREGRGEILMRGIAENQAHSTCKGLIEIGLTGGGTNTYLTQEVLMLDATSKVDAIPALEIKTNDVKASHSATVARVTEEDLFYFGARGIDPHEARRMFVLGFLGDITERIPDENIRTEVIEMIEKKYAVS
jgi:Fe-S cluster assembly scaffold protein SufB